MKAKIIIDTFNDAKTLVDICSRSSKPVYITDENGLRVSAKSLLGTLYALEFSEIWLETEDETIYQKLIAFIV